MLGFKVDFHDLIGSVSRGRCALFLVEGDQGNPGIWVWVGVNDVDSFHAEYIERGAKIRQAPTNSPWACEMQVEDFGGNVLRLGSESKPDRPFGPWCDMHSRLLTWSPDGKWASERG